MRGEKQKGRRFQSRGIVLGWLNFDLDKQGERGACVRACFEKFVRETCSFARIDTRSRRYLVVGFFLESQMAADAVVSLDKFVINGAHIVKKKLPPFFPPPRRDLLVISWGSLGVLFGVQHELLLIERTYLNSCLRLVRTKLSSRARMCFYLSLCVHACVCACAWMLYTRSPILLVYVTLKFRVAKYLVSSRRYAISPLS